MTVDRTKVLRFLNAYQQGFKYKHNAEEFEVAVCQVQLGNYAEAWKSFEKSCKGMLKTRLWESTSEPNLLVDICVLSGGTNLYPKVLQELETYKTDHRGDSPVALYAYALMELLLPSGNDITIWIQGLLKKPRYKDTFAMGQTFQAIVDEDQAALDIALADLLKAHEGMAKYGGLRETAEGLLCMPAMSLAYVALKRDLEVEIENDYLSLGYLEYLLKREEQEGRKATKGGPFNILAFSFR